MKKKWQVWAINNGGHTHLVAMFWRKRQAREYVREALKNHDFNPYYEIKKVYAKRF